jgi:hypothetical protein
MMSEDTKNNTTLHHVIHIFLLLVLIAVVILFITNSSLLLADNFLVSGIKYIANMTIFKFFIIKFSQSIPAADAYLSVLYLTFTLLFINLYFVSTKYKSFSTHEAALQNQYHFSGVMDMHVYKKLFPTIAISGARKKFTDKQTNKDFDEYLIEQLDNEATKNHFMMIAGFAFVLLPLAAIYLPNTETNHLVKYWMVCLAMVYLQTKITFEAFLIYKALTR